MYRDYIAYWEVILGKNPDGVRIGVKRFDFKHKSPLEEPMTGKTDGDEPTWVMAGNGLKEGDVIGIRWDQTDLPMLSFLKNNAMVDIASFNRIRPAVDIVPAVSVIEGSTCQVIFDQKGFKHPPNGTKFKMIVCATSLI